MTGFLKWKWFIAIDRPDSCRVLFRNACFVPTGTGDILFYIDSRQKSAGESTSYASWIRFFKVFVIGTSLINENVTVKKSGKLTKQRPELVDRLHNLSSTPQTLVRLRHLKQKSIVRLIISRETGT